MKTKKRTTATTKNSTKEAPLSPSSSLLTSPIISFTTPDLICNSPKRFFDFNLNGFDNINSNNNNTTTTTKNKKSKTTQIATKSSLLIKSSTVNLSPSHKTLVTISDLKDLVSSRTDSLKRHVDSSHLEILKEFEASQSRISKRFKIHMQTCQQMGDEVDKECKKLSDAISENADAMKKSYEQIMKQAEASTARLCKTSITELEQSMEKSIQGLRSRYRFPMGAA